MFTSYDDRRTSQDFKQSSYVGRNKMISTMPDALETKLWLVQFQFSSDPTPQIDRFLMANRVGKLKIVNKKLLIYIGRVDSAADMERLCRIRSKTIGKINIWISPYKQAKKGLKICMSMKDYEPIASSSKVNEPAKCEIVTPNKVANKNNNNFDWEPLPQRVKQIKKKNVNKLSSNSKETMKLKKHAPHTFQHVPIYNAHASHTMHDSISIPSYRDYDNSRSKIGYKSKANVGRHNERYDELDDMDDEFQEMDDEDILALISNSIRNDGK